MKPITLAGYFLSAWIVSISAHAQSLTPQSFVEADIAVREITLDGMAERVLLRSNGPVELDVELASDQAYQQAVTNAYGINGTTANTHALYGTQNSQAISAWLERNPEWQAQYDAITAEFESLSAQLDGLRGSNE